MAQISGVGMMEGLTPLCPYCRQFSVPTDGVEMYPHRPDLAHKKFFVCEPCDAYVGCHPNGKPMGTLANAELRELRKKAHRLLDPLWKSQPRNNMYPERVRLYKLMASMMGISREECHIAMFDTEQVLEAIRLLETNKWLNKNLRLLDYD